MQNSPEHIASWLRGKLPLGQKDADWDYLEGQFPWYPFVHLLRAAGHREQTGLLQKASVYQNDLLRLNAWLNIRQVGVEPEIGEPLAGEPPAITEESLEGQDLETNAGDQPADEPAPQSAEGSSTPEMAPVELGAASPLEGLIPITPYYTVDYFASQGLKIEQKVSPEFDTEFDKQVKSFTDWLKTMKRLNYQPKATYTDPLVDSTAKASLQKKEIVTEAMAEVWAKQGNLQMAAQVYAKLMLLHPEKTPYFAARLQELKLIQ